MRNKHTQTPHFGVVNKAERAGKKVSLPTGGSWELINFPSVRRAKRFMRTGKRS